MNLKPLLALAAVGLLAFAGLAVEAKEGPKREAPKDPKEFREKAKEARDEAREKCAAADANSTMEKRCELAKKGFKARREGHALLRAIEVHERLLGRVDYRIEVLSERLASGNFTGNETAEKVQEKLDKLEARHDKIVERLDALNAKLEALKAKWAEVRDHVDAKRGPHAEHEDDEEEPASTSSTASA